MLSNALSMLIDLGPGAETPPNGTGPLGAPPDGRRWITRDDVVAWNGATCALAPEDRGVLHDTLGTRCYTPIPNALRDYQQDAVRACNPDDKTFRSGVVHMECGTGKTWVASELIRRSRGQCVVVAQHAVSVTQFVAHLRTTLGLLTASLQDEEVSGDLDACDVVVTTYARIARVVGTIDEHRECISQGAYARSSHSPGDRLLARRLCEPVALLVLDEVHTAVAERFQCACRLRAHAVVGFSGSLVREDDRLAALTDVVGPTLYTYGNVDRVHSVRVHRVPVDDPRVRTATSRTALHQTMRALNPRKVDALLRILCQHADQRVIVFSDAVRPVEVLHATVLRGRSLLLHGGVASREARDETILTFSRAPPGTMVLLCTRVCDVSIDFPVGCVIVQYQLASGSRQQEVQRCGRGTRGAEGALVYHLVNSGTDEERFSERRIAHLREEMWGTVAVEEDDARGAREMPASVVDPLDSLLRIKIDVPTRACTIAKRPRRHGRILLESRPPS